MNINIKAEPGSNVQVTDKPIYNITNVKGDLVQNKTVIYQNADDSVEDAVEINDDVQLSQADKYPEIKDMNRSFFEQKYLKEVELGKPKVKTDTPVEKILHIIFDNTQEWNTKETTRKWRILYEVLKDKKFFKVNDKERFKDYVNAVVKYCLSDVSDTYNNNISKCKIEFGEPGDIPTQDKILYRDMKKWFDF